MTDTTEYTEKDTTDAPVWLDFREASAWASGYNKALEELAAYEASVRADQIEKDAMIVDNRIHPGLNPCDICDYVTAIRAQLGGQS